MAKVFGLIFTSFLLLSASFVFASSVQGNQGVIWTTTSLCGEREPQDINRYDVGEAVYVRGQNFNVGTYDWVIVGLGNVEESSASCDPGLEVARGQFSVDSSGEFCFDAYHVVGDDCGVYRVDFNDKRDNYRVNVASVPEFGTILGLATLIGAIGIFFVVRRD